MKLKEMNKKNSEIINKRFKDFSPEKKLELSMQLYYSAKELKRAALKQIHPDWNDVQIEKEVRRIFMYART